MDDLMISVIMPVYNAGAHIEKSIRSVMKQCCNSKELICIDDGSTDDTIEIIEELSKEYRNIRLIKQQHNGAGSARNLGIQNSNGKYISFLDADDEYVDPSALERMIYSCERNHAYICGSNRIVSESGEDKDAGLFADYNIPVDGCFISYKEYQQDYDYQSFIFEKDFLIKNGIEFPNYMRYQDPPFFIKAMIFAESFYVVPVILYKYYFDGQKIELIKKHINHVLNGIIASLQLAAENGFDKLFCRVRSRVDEEYRDVIVSCLNDGAMSLLLEINRISKKYDGKEIKLTRYIYGSAAKFDELGRSHCFFEKIMRVSQKRGLIGNYLREKAIETVSVYGAGKFGRILINELNLNRIKIACVIDQRLVTLQGLDIKSPDEEIPPCDAIIVSLLDSEEVTKELRRKGGNKVITFIDITEELWEQSNE